MTLMLGRSRFAGHNIKAGNRDGSEQLSPKRELMERFGMSHPIDQIDNPHTKPLQMEHGGQKSSGRSQSDVPLEGFLLREILSERAVTAIDEIHRHVA
jgi:hypothetical protein